MKPALLVAAIFGIGLAVDYLASISGVSACVTRQVEMGDTEGCRINERR